jgi:hypothetical protein
MSICRSIGVKLVVCGVVLSSFSRADAALITSNDIVAIPSGVTGSGNGTIDLRLFTFSGSEIQNTSGLFNGDNGNNSLPQGGGADTHSFTHSYITTAGKLKSYYNLNFTPNSINNLTLFLDLNETGSSAQATNSLLRLDVVLNPTTVSGNPNPVSGDVSSSQQSGILQSYTGGSLIANLNPQPAKNLPVNNQGAGFADYAILTGINVFNLNNNDVLLFNISMNKLNNGAEEIFLSGTYSPTDVAPPVPEPTALAMIGIGALLAARRQFKK